MDATLKEVNIWNSIKKFFIDGLDGTGITPYFDRIMTNNSTTDGPTRWVNIMVENLVPAHVSNANLTAFCFTKEDHEGDELSHVRDEIVGLFYGGSIDLYDTSVTPWTKIGGMIVVMKGQSKTIYNPDKSKLVYVQTLIKWGSVWS